MNFRDLGGISTENGKKIKVGIFFRSAMLDEATENDIEFLKSLNLYQIFDYRDDEEVRMLKKDPYSLIGTKHSHYPSNIYNRKLYSLKKNSIWSRIFTTVSLDDVKEVYADLPFDNKGYKAMVDALKNDEVPFYQHCTAGKDRAGLGSALLLGILGVPYEYILEDYMKSMVIKDYIQDKIARVVPKPFRKLIIKKYEPLFIVDKSLLDSAVEAINKKYNSFENYLLMEYNLDKKNIEKIRNRYTI